MDSQKKGKAYERHLANKLKDWFKEDVRRTGAQEKWKSRSGDVNPRNSSSILGRYHWEAKKREAWAILEWWKKAKDDAETYRTPVVVASRNNEDDYVFMKLEDFLKLLKELDGFLKKE